MPAHRFAGYEKMFSNVEVRIAGCYPLQDFAFARRELLVEPKEGPPEKTGLKPPAKPELAVHDALERTSKIFGGRIASQEARYSASKKVLDLVTPDGERG
jgi:hypothetical protein